MTELEETLEQAAQILGGWACATETSRPEPHRIDAALQSAQDLVPLVTGLRVKRLGRLTAITGMDLGPEAGEMEVLYHFCVGRAVITLRVRTPREDPVVPSLSGIIPSAEVFERELAEMFGVRLEGLPDPARLYLPDDWPEGVYPLRKDFDATTLT